MGNVAENVEIIHEKISNAAAASGRSSSEIELMAVTKTLDFDAVEAALENGIDLIGENRVQEATGKHPTPPRDYRLEWERLSGLPRSLRLCWGLMSR